MDNDYRFFSAIIILTWINVSSSSSNSASGSVQEYCQMETFQPRCTHGDVISMTTALFGRMRVGRCITSDAFQLQQVQPDSLGCSADVIGYFDQVCSSKASCDVFVPNPELFNYRPCSAQLSMYLEASYSCVSVADEDRQCSLSASVGSLIYLPKTPKTRQNSNRCGSRSNPWVIEAQTGQKINISLRDFGPHQPGQSCDSKYGYVIDKAAAAAKNKTICGGMGRDRFVYQSKGNAIEIVVSSTESNSENSNQNFLLGVEAVGCSNLVPPVDAWLRRTDNEATVGCYTTRQRWHLRCEDGQWKGTIGQCQNTELFDDTTGLDVLVASVKSEDTTVLKMSALLAVSFVGLAVCLVIIFVGIGCSQRYKRQISTLKAGQYPSMPRNQQHVSNMVNLGPHTNENIGFTSTDARHQYFILDKEITASDIVGVET